MKAVMNDGWTEIRGLSTETKPTTTIGIANTSNEAVITVGDTYLEIDTGDLYIYSGSAWVAYGGE